MAEEKIERWTGGGKFDDWSQSKGRNGAVVVECYNCGGLWHLARVCPSVCYTRGCGGEHLSRDCPRRSQKKIWKKNMGDHIHIPPDICREILFMLPPVSLIRFRSVSKAWRSIIDDPSFVKAHTHKQQPSILLRNSSGPPFLYTFDLETLIPTANGSQQKIPASTLNLSPSLLPRLYLPVSTCNGLMLIIPPDWKEPKPGQETWEIWNTLTQERLELPPSQNSRHWSMYSLVGLGYDHYSDDYKVVEIVRISSCELQPHVYSLKSDTWRTMKTDFFSSMWNADCFGEAAFIRGALHWISSIRMDDVPMFSFDVGTETLREFKSPPGLRFSHCRYFLHRKLHVDVLDGCLAVSDYAHDDCSLFQHFDIWVMKEYGVEDSWTLLYKLPAFYSGSHPKPSLYWMRPVACMNKDKRQLLMQDGLGRLYLVDVEKNSVKIVDIQGFGDGSATAQVFHGTIFRLHDNCGVTAGRRRRRTRGKMKSDNYIFHTQLLFRLNDFRFVGPRPTRDEYNDFLM